jgi:hypothetical protein
MKKLVFGDTDSRAEAIADARHTRLMHAVESLAREHRDNPERLSVRCTSWIDGGHKLCGKFAWEPGHMDHLPSRLWMTAVRDAAGLGKKGALSPEEVLAAIQRGLGSTEKDGT